MMYFDVCAGMPIYPLRKLLSSTVNQDRAQNSCSEIVQTRYRTEANYNEAHSSGDKLGFGLNVAIDEAELAPLQSHHESSSESRFESTSSLLEDHVEDDSVSENEHVLLLPASLILSGDRSLQTDVVEAASADLRERLQLGGEKMTKRVSFPDLPPLPPLGAEQEQGKKKPRKLKRTSPGQSAVTPNGKGKKVTVTPAPSAAENARIKEFHRSVRGFKSLITGLEVDLHDVVAETEQARAAQSAAVIKKANGLIRTNLRIRLEKSLENDGHSARIADVCAAATPEVRDYLHSVLQSWVNQLQPRHDGQGAASKLHHSLLPAVKLLELHLILADARADCAQIDEDDPDHGRRVAAAHAAAYPPVLVHFEAFRADRERSGILEQDQCTALVLAAMGIAVLETAFSSIHWASLVPIKVTDTFSKHSSPLLTARRIPWKLVSFDEACDFDAESRVLRAVYTIQTLTDLVRVLRLPEDRVSAALHNCHVDIVERDLCVASKAKFSALQQEFALVDFHSEEAVALQSQMREKHRTLCNECDGLRRSLYSARAAPPVSGPALARQRAVEDVHSLALLVAQAGNELIEYYARDHSP